MNEKTITVLKGGRTALQFLAEPIDYLIRGMNYKKGYPPLRLRQMVGSLNDFEGSGGEYMAYLKLLCDLKSGDNVMDIGSGCGLMCLKVNENPTLPGYIKPGSYVGIDTNKTLVDWCNRYIKLTNGFFVTPPIKNRLPGLNETVDVILCKSLFTHLFKHEVESYLSEIRRLLKPKGRCLATFFLLNDKEYKGRYSFGYYEGDFSLERYSQPRAAVAYEEEWIQKTLEGFGFSHEVHYGSWRGDNKGLSFQDIIILRKEDKE